MTCKAFLQRLRRSPSVVFVLFVAKIRVNLCNPWLPLCLFVAIKHRVNSCRFVVILFVRFRGQTKSVQISEFVVTFVPFVAPKILQTKPKNDLVILSLSKDLSPDPRPLPSARRGVAN